MRVIESKGFVSFPRDVIFRLENRVIHVNGPRGQLRRDFRNLNLEMERFGKKLRVRKCKSRLQVRKQDGDRCHPHGLQPRREMIKGVSLGFRYKLRAVFAHFPINVSIQDAGRTVEIRNFLGEKIVRKVPLPPGVSAVVSTAQKDELVIEGNDVQLVSQAAARIQQSTCVKNKDIRKFLDGVYVSENTTIA